MDFRHRNKNTNLTKTLKDYAIPIIALLLMLVIFYNVFSSSNKSVDKNLENGSWIKIIFDSALTDASVEYKTWKKAKIESNTSLYKWENLTVKEWSVTMKIWDMDLFIDKMWIFEYQDNGTLFLDSSNMWVKTKLKSDLKMKFLNISAWTDSVFNLYQNEVESSVYVLSWTVEVSNLAEQSIILSAGEKINLLSSDASKIDVDLSSLKWEFDEYFKTSDWFIKNAWSKYLKTKETETSTWKTDETRSWTTSSKTKVSWLITFDDLVDESSIDSSTTEITWTYNTIKVARITLNWVNAKLDSEEKTFTFPSVTLSKKTNDLIFRLYDENDELINKIVYTIYSDSNNNTATDNSSELNKVNEKTSTNESFKNTDIDASKFIFTRPSSNSVYTTYETQVDIKWATPTWISQITVNDYKLKSFNWKTWRYHAFIEQWTMKNGTNLYEIKYFDASWAMVYKNQFTIIKKSKNTTSSTSE